MSLSINQLRDNCRKNLIQYTLKAFSGIPAIDQPLILDMGCGTGVPSLALLEICNGSIYAVDSDSGSLEWLNEKVEVLNYTDRIKVIQASLFDVNLPVGSFDIVLAEGLLNVVGFDKGLPVLVNFLKPGGYLIIHDELKDDTEKKTIFARYHLQLLDAFELDENVWWKDYYACLEELIRQEKNVSLFENEINEIAEIKKYPEKFRSIYYVLHKHSQSEFVD